MPTHLVTAITTRDLATRLADTLMEGEHHLPVTAAGAFEQAPPDWRFEAWLTTAPDLGEFTRTMRAILGNAADAVAFEHRRVDDADWVRMSLDDLPPVRAGRFVVHGAHDRAKVPANAIALEIEAAMAFGTGHHATTLGCLLEIETWLRTHRAGHALDIGTGTGVLAIALARAAPMRVLAGDVDADAVRIARENVLLNRCRRRVDVVQAVGTAHPRVRASAPYLLVVANILAGPLIASAPSFSRAVAPGGTLILSGLLAWQALSVEGAYLSRGFRLARRRIIGDWATLVLVKRGAHVRGRAARIVRPPRHS